ncbi:MAG: hypothetical protein H6940_02485 [Burkholderiales bacterium]|uniref:HNH endonuclease n=1 Tax=Nitrosomonas sp. TaxID=42353 RepID=UPI001D420230|nr:HNH endonuclease [Nitrosomonas sp.]MCB1948106.1 hypothetical protein [Nitrosomonas sp.]MCP5242296.1 hypothetical protein [Burkholderiales bacterium]
MAFCIYSGSDVKENELNKEHIFPLTLGGNNSFTVYVSKLCNTRANREIDEKLKSCLFLATNRKRNESRGHRNKAVTPPKTKISVGSDKSVTFRFDDYGNLQLYSHKQSKLLTREEINSERIVIKTDFNEVIRLKFAAKVALASGYFVYEDVFIKNAEVSDLRALMNYKGELHDKNDFNNITSKGWFWPKPVGDKDVEMHKIFEHINSMFNCSFVALITSAVPNEIIIVVGVLGQLVGVISCSANCDAFPKSGEYDLGHVIALKDRELQRISYRNCLNN